MNPIQTYVFMDLETTGLPKEENNTTKIAELSMIAVKRKHLLDTAKGKSPRVQNKLTLCFNPCKMMQPDGTTVTGLCNFLLENEMRLDKNSFQLIDTFLSLLTQPVCLIAHNGNNFDFPILKNNLEKINVHFSCNIKCADCFYVFYDILDSINHNFGSENGGILPSTSKKMKIDENESSSNEESKVKLQLEKDCNSELKSAELNVINDTAKEIFLKGPHNSTEKSSPNIAMMNIENSSSNIIIDLSSDEPQYMQKVNEITPKKSNSEISNHAIDTCDATDTLIQNIADFVDGDIIKWLSNDSKHMQKANESTPKQKVPCVINPHKRKVRKGFPWSKTSKPTESYKLGEIYKRQLNRESPEAHRAENDCVMAMEIAVTIAQEFVEWVDKHNTDFKDIEAMTIGVKI